MITNLKIKDIVYFAIVMVFMSISMLVGVYFLFISDLKKFSNDLKRIRHINDINGSVSSFYSTQKKLPKSLSQLSVQYYFDQTFINDPVSGEPIEYKPISEKDYKICVNFEVGSDRIIEYKNTLFKGNDGLSALQDIFEEYRNSGGSKFQFDVGYQCLDFTVTDTVTKRSSSQYD